MRFLVEHIDDRGRQVEAGLADPWLRAAIAEAFDVEPTAASATLDVQNVKGIVHVSGHIAASTERPCDRCGEPTSLVVDTDVDLHYAPKGKEADAGSEQELAKDELDVGWYEGGELVLADVVREAVALEMPPRVTCLDAGPCDERVARLLSVPESSTVHPALASLKSLLSH